MNRGTLFFVLFIMMIAGGMASRVSVLRADQRGDESDRFYEWMSSSCPIRGLVIGTYNDLTTYTYIVSTNATSQQIQDARNRKAAYGTLPADWFRWKLAHHPELRFLSGNAPALISDIDGYLAGSDTATATQVRAEVKALDQRQKIILRALQRMIPGIIGNDR